MSEKIIDSRPGLLVFITMSFGAALTVGRATSWLASQLITVGESGSISELLVGVVALQIVGFGSVICVAIWRQGAEWRSFLHIQRPTEWDAFYGTATGLAMMVVASLATGLFRVLDIETVESATGVAVDPVFYVVLLVVSTLVVVPIEEAFFRGFVQTRLEQRFHTAVAIGVASLFFVVVHTNVSVGTGGELLALGLFFSLGVVLGVSYAVTENLLVPIIGHAVYNGAQIFVRTLEVLA
ncbi:CPBP family intramembrane glutamic endopeptidase [Halovenus rubra]|uniref:CPBP family intramembrane glutamic endopeptidase n=2 Tax=Halovenus rubra TaxID=869890 RepID=A0ABD5X7Q1_9EURY|nr:type II CAAX endopeptidase family protein [Halovenus rubra]